MSNDPDLLLKSLLATPDRAPDEGFALRIERLVRIEARMRAARRVAWTRFAVEMVATAALLVAYWRLTRLTPVSPDSVIPLYSPAAAGLLLLALWVGVSVRPGGRFSGN
ncbi:MAG: hypothetical protein QOE79_1149 [Sphingomonadales bacterium]|jgi:hypothetical protein|nr:hypothetical protein [Sphingomonadales bacterium]